MQNYLQMYISTWIQLVFADYTIEVKEQTDSVLKPFYFQFSHIEKPGANFLYTNALTNIKHFSTKQL